MRRCFSPTIGDIPYGARAIEALALLPLSLEDRALMHEIDISTEFDEAAMLPFHLAMATAVLAVDAAFAVWLLPHRLMSRWHEPHEQLVLPKPIEDDSERCLFA